MPVIPSLAVSIGLGIIIENLYHFWWLFPLSITSIGTICSLFFLRFKPIFFLPLLLATAAAAGAFLLSVEETINSYPELTEIIKHAEISKKPVIIEGTVISAPVIEGKRVRFVVRAQKVGQYPREIIKVQGNLRVSASAERTDLPEYSDIIKIEGRVSGLDFLDPPVKKYYKMQGIVGFFLVPDFLPIHISGKKRVFPLFKAGQYMGKRFIDTLFNNIKQPEASILGQIMFGKSVNVPDEINEAFRKAGVVHILVVSGLHVWIVLSVFISLAFLWKRNAKITFIVLSSV
ncbi:MAG: ComEC/Rec2 family competence protein, partial [bacterium]